MNEVRTIKIRTDDYRALKILAAERGVTMLDLVSRMIQKEKTMKLSYIESVRYLCGDRDAYEGQDLRDEARTVITDAVWGLAKEDGDGKGEMWNWIAEGDWSPADLSRLDAFSPAALAAEWDQYQRDARAAIGE
jgi:hypothetical protein